MLRITDVGSYKLDEVLHSERWASRFLEKDSTDGVENVTA